jgi:quinol monooxygenase YgiN
MIIVAGTVTIRPEYRQQAIQSALQMALTTEVEDGCISYRFSADLQKPDTFCIFEVWETAEALERHFQTDHMRVFQQQLPQFLAGAPDIHRYEVGTVSRM